MSIVPYDKKTIELFTIPKTIKLPVSLKNREKEYLDKIENLEKKVLELSQVHDNNLKFYQQKIHFQKKYEEYKNQYDKMLKLNIDYKKILDNLNMILLCPELKQPISIYQCNRACLDNICDSSWKCEKRISDLKFHLHIP